MAGTDKLPREEVVVDRDGDLLAVAAVSSFNETPGDYVAIATVTSASGSEVVSVGLTRPDVAGLRDLLDRLLLSLPDAEATF